MRRGKKEGLMAYNDYELIYLSRFGDEDVVNIMIVKYEPLIHKMISNFNVPNLNKDDYLQEGRLIINKAIKSYNELSKMTFTKYLEMLLYHRFIDLARKNNKNNYELMEIDKIEYFYDSLNTANKVNEDIVINYEGLSEFERNVFYYKYILGYSSKNISVILDVPIKKVYSATERIVKKKDNIFIN